MAARAVLVVDDEEPFLHALRAALLREGYNAIAAINGLDALEQLRDFQGQIDLLLTDLTMPGMDGLSLAHRVLADHPNVAVLLMSAHLSVPSHFPLLRKPFRITELLKRVSSIIEDRGSSAS